MNKETYDTRLTHARQLRHELTPWERKLWYTFLKDYPLHFYRQRPVSSFILDFYCPVAKLAIELDGSQHYGDAGLAYDAARDAYLRGKGIYVLRLANIDVDRRFKEVCEYIDREIAKRKG